MNWFYNDAMMFALNLFLAHDHAYLGVKKIQKFCSVFQWIQIILFETLKRFFSWEFSKIDSKSNGKQLNI